MVEKTLIFHFYIPKEYKENIAVRMHLECLKRYSHIFDHALFVLSVNDDSRHLVNEVEKDIIDCGFDKDLHFKVRDNDGYYEARTFKEEIVDHLGDLDGLVFFAHSKGISNVVDFPERTENIMKWVYGMYYYSFEFMYEVEKKMIGTFFGRFTSLFGPFLQKCTWDTRGGAHFPGTFYWLNPAAICNDLKNNEIELPHFADRVYAERFPNIYPFNDGKGKVSSHMYRWINEYDFYRSSIDALVNYFGDAEEYFKNYNEIMEKIK